MAVSAASTKARPKAVTLLGWFWVRLGGVSLLVSPVVFVLSRILAHRSPEGRFPPPENFPPGLGPLEWIFEHFSAFLALQAVVSALTLYAALRFLKLRPWSRTYFEVLSWLGLVGSLGFGLYWWRLWSGMVANVAPSPAAAALQAMGIVAPLVLVAISGLLLWLLRSRHVRPAFSSESRRKDGSGYNPGP